MKVEKIMKNTVYKVQKTATISDALKKLSKDPEGCVIVQNKSIPVGIVTGTDAIKFLSNKKLKHNQSVTKIMSTPLYTIKCDASLQKALKNLDTRKFSNYPITLGQKVIGTTSPSDIVHKINDNMKFHRNVQNAVLVAFLLYAIIIIFFYGGSFQI